MFSHCRAYVYFVSEKLWKNDRVPLATHIRVGVFPLEARVIGGRYAPSVGVAAARKVKRPTSDDPLPFGPMRRSFPSPGNGDPPAVLRDPTSSGLFVQKIEF